jgi:hypothetical protein
MNEALKALFDADRREHQAVPPVDTAAYADLRERDRCRRAKAGAILKTLAHPSPEDLSHAAWLFNHGDDHEEARFAFELASRSAAMGQLSARWLSAAAYDRWCMYRGRPQRYGTQIVPDGKGYRLWDVDPATTDEERASFDVPPLSEQTRRAQEMSHSGPQPPMERAPKWLQEALERWRRNETPETGEPAGAESDA